jgi:predicted dehydrogenase
MTGHAQKRMNHSTRRGFLGGAAASLALPYLLPDSVFGANAPSNRITMGCIGVGGMGTNNMMGFLNNDDVQMLAVCDPETGSNGYNHWYNTGGWLGREPAIERVNKHYAEKRASGTFKGCDGYVDFRKLLARADIDAVMIATPYHWHAIGAIAAARGGKDIYCEKPLTLTVAEGRAIVRAVESRKVIFQTGTHHRSADTHLRRVCELIRNGRIGKVKRVISHIDPNNRTTSAKKGDSMPIPKGFDYDMWLGPAPKEPYHRDRTHYTFRFVQDYSGGQTTNLGVHALDIVQWALGTDRTGPIEFEDLGAEFPSDGLFDTATKVHFRAKYASGTELICETDNDRVVARFEGTEGWIEATYGSFKTSPAALKDSVIGPDEIRLYKSNDHKRNFLDCIKTRKETITPAEVGHRSTSLCLLANIAMSGKRKIRWDPDTERIIGDEQASRMLSKPMRAPWRL